MPFFYQVAKFHQIKNYLEKKKSTFQTQFITHNICDFKKKRE